MLLPVGYAVSVQAEIDRRDLALLTALEVELQPLALVQIGDAGTLHGRNMDEDVFRTVIRLDEAIALLGIEPLLPCLRTSRNSEIARPRAGFARRVKRR